MRVAVTLDQNKMKGVNPIEKAERVTQTEILERMRVVPMGIDVADPLDQLVRQKDFPMGFGQMDSFL
jgi:hypothetical protein